VFARACHDLVQVILRGLIQLWPLWFVWSLASNR
jgi:hypothetical protein